MSTLQATSSIVSDRCPVSPVTFAASGEYVVSSGGNKVRVWRVEDGKLVATMTVEHVQCVALSKDGKWIAAGTYWGDVMVWDAKVYRQTFTTWRIDDVVRGVDFSPDATRLIALGERTATVWNIATHERVVRPLHHEDCVWAAKYSPKGDRIATATQKSVRVYDSQDGRSLVDINIISMGPRGNTSLLWLNHHLFVISDSKIKQIEALTGLEVSEWQVSCTNHSCIAIPRHGEFIACSANDTVTFWDTSTHTQLGLVHHPQDINSITLSPDGRFLAIASGGEHERITIKRLSRITESDIQIDDAALQLWKDDRLEDAEESLTIASSLSQNQSYHVFASRALVRARLQRWDEAIADAKESIMAQPSVIGYIAKSVSLVGKGKKHEAYRACDIAFEHCHSTHVSFLLLIKAVIVCMAGEHSDAISRVDDLIATLHLNSLCYVVQSYMRLLLGNSYMERGNYENAIRSFDHARAQLRYHTSRALSVVSLISGWKFDDLDITIRQRLCEALYAAGRTNEAGESLLGIVNTVDEEIYIRGPITIWVSDFLERYLSVAESSGAATSGVARVTDISVLYAPTLLLKEWAKLKLTRGSWRDTLAAAVSFMVSRFTIYRAICEQLDAFNKITDATECLHQMTSELKGEIDRPSEQAKWVSEFKQDLSQKLEYQGDAAMHTGQYDEAISEYSAALSLELASPQCLFIKRSKAYVARGFWENSLQDANKVITLDPSSPWGYERKHAALHAAGRYDDAICALETMLLKISRSPDPKTCECLHEYVNPAQTKAVIRKAVQDTIRESPRVLIHTISGRLLDKTKQAALFESLPVFKELISSMTTHIDYAQIQREVAHYYRYATFSHTWEDNEEPLFEEVINIIVYDLEESFTHNKLRMFCKIARDAGLHWAWSDTCCINKADHFVLQQALVAMFKWYEGSAVTIVFLRGVHSPSRRGDLTRSHWNTRAWTFQEYHASKVVRFYTEEWTPYMNLDIANHKDSPEITSEMEETGISAPALMDLRPGLHDIREKLCLASRRQTTFVEDAAYSLLGIFSTPLPILYGEGDQALGRLLAQLLTSSGDTSILAWTGNSGSFNSCLPASISVFSELPTTHIPRAITSAEMGIIKPRMRPSSPTLTLVMKLYSRLHELPVPSFANQRMKLPCLTFKLGQVSTRSTSGHVFRAKTGALGVVEIRTTEDLSRFDSLILVHPWIDFLLDRHPVGNILETITESTNHQSSTHDSPSLSDLSSTAQVVKQTRKSRIISHIGRPFSGWVGDGDSLLSPSPESLTDRRMEALRFINRLKKPFGALLFTQIRQNVKEFRRVATESLITVQVEELTSTVLNKLIDGADTLDVL